MNENRLIDAMTRLKGSMSLDDWVLCRVRLKGNSMLRHTWEVHDTRNTEMVEYLPKTEDTNNEHDMITDSLYKDCQLLASSVLSNQTLPRSY
ncbi:hypothetical protein Q3G72_016645 [Acer saccharum]|nr:hypothetical protein Q3G72_003733 [Acer saccharum]KAK1587770.1 hypothetical protein Q3G72_016645 [Acer saccharum]